MQTIKASAGSGKTFRLTVEYITNIIAAPSSYRNILAVTFTNKATAEMKERILKELCNLAFNPDVERELFFKEIYANVDFPNTSHQDKVELIKSRAKVGLKSILHDYSKFSISTIDKFFQRIIRSFMRELGLEGGYDITFDNDYLNEMAIDRLVDQGANDEELWQMILAIIEDNIANNKPSDIKFVLKDVAMHISDKEFNREELLSKISYLSQSFTLVREAYKDVIKNITRCAVNVRVITERYGLTQDDIPSKSRGYLADIKKIESGKIGYGAYTKKTANGEGKWGRACHVEAQDSIVAALNELIVAIDDNMPYIISAKAIMENDNYFLLLAHLASTLDQIGKERGSLLMSSSIKLLSTLTAECEVPFIYEKCGTIYSKFMIDEFQDTSLEQWQNFKPLVKNALSQGESKSSNVVLLGDIKQSIYGWRGGDWRLLGGQAQSDVAGESQPREQVVLQTNYRSFRNIIEFNNALMKGFIVSVNESLNQSITEAQSNGHLERGFVNSSVDVLLNAYSDVEQLVPPHQDEKRGYVDFTITNSAEKENLMKMVEVIKDVQDRGFTGGDIAILLRTKSEAKLVADYLVDYRSAVEKEGGELSKYNFDFVSAEVLQLSNSKVIKFIVNLLKLSVLGEKKGTKELYIHNLLLSKLGCGLDSDRELEFFDSLKLKQIIEAFESIVAFYKLGEISENVTYLQAIHQHIVGFSSSKGGDKNDFVEWWESEGASLNLYIPNTTSSITLVTVHKAKGLEFGVVIMPFANWRQTPKSGSLFWAKSHVPPLDGLGRILLKYSDSLNTSLFSQSYYNHTIQAVIESCNILYVALTRSRCELYMMIPNKVSKNDNGQIIVEQVKALSKDMLKVKSGKEEGYTYGEKVVKKGFVYIEQPRLYAPTYRSYNYSSRIKIKQSLERYYQEDREQNLSPRHYGVIMHRLFEDSNTLEQILLSLNQMLTDAIITQEQYKQTHNALTRAFENPIIADWFDPRWEVKAENDILIPSLQSGGKFLTSRPDRVLIGSNEVVVIDYKFGLPSPNHHKQVAQYMSLLQSMGYNNCKGYVWYILSNEIVKVG